MFWADEIVEDILKKSSKNSFIITDALTPSGHAHIGSLRGVIIHDLVRRGLIEAGKSAEFIYIFDDFDPLDGLPVYLEKSWLKHMGKPLSEIPAPDGKHKSFAEQYASEFEAVFNNLGIRPKIARTSELYREGKFDNAIKIMLDRAQEIRTIYKEVSGSDKGPDWFPLQVVCPRCGKIGTTRVTDWNGREVRFQCQENLVSWAKGCGAQDSVSPFGGKAKLPWKVEWPVQWQVFGSDIEGEGKDHFAAGGSRDIADRIARSILKINPPYDIRYEHILVGGAKMSSSKGLGVTAKDMAEFLPENLLRFLFIRTRYKRTIEFQPEGETIPLLYDEYDRAAAAAPKSDLARAFYYTQIDVAKPQPQHRLRFSKVANLLQMPRCDIFDYAQKEKGRPLSEIERKEIENRLRIAKEWLKKFAPEDYQFAVQEQLPEAAKDLSKEQKEFLRKIAEIVATKDLNGEELHREIHRLRQEMGIVPRQAFAAIYLIFLGKDSGPQAGWLLASLDKKLVLERLKGI